MKVKNLHSIIFSKNKNLGWTTELLNKFHNNSRTLQEHFQEIPQQLATLKSCVWIFTHNPVIFHPPPMSYPLFFLKISLPPFPKIKTNLKCSQPSVSTGRIGGLLDNVALNCFTFDKKNYFNWYLLQNLSYFLGYPLQMLQYQFEICTNIFAAISSKKVNKDL